MGFFDRAKKNLKRIGEDQMAIDTSGISKKVRKDRKKKKEAQAKAKELAIEKQTVEQQRVEIVQETIRQERERSAKLVESLNADKASIQQQIQKARQEGDQITAASLETNLQEIDTQLQQSLEANKQAEAEARGFIESDIEEREAIGERAGARLGLGAQALEQESQDIQSRRGLAGALSRQEEVFANDIAEAQARGDKGAELALKINRAREAGRTNLDFRREQSQKRLNLAGAAGALAGQETDIALRTGGGGRELAGLSLGESRARQNIQQTAFGRGQRERDIATERRLVGARAEAQQEIGAVRDIGQEERGLEQELGSIERVQKGGITDILGGQAASLAEASAAQSAAAQKFANRPKELLQTGLTAAGTVVGTVVGGPAGGVAGGTAGQIVGGFVAPTEPVQGVVPQTGPLNVNTSQKATVGARLAPGGEASDQGFAGPTSRVKAQIPGQIDQAGQPVPPDQEAPAGAAQPDLDKTRKRIAGIRSQPQPPAQRVGQNLQGSPRSIS